MIIKSIKIMALSFQGKPEENTSDEHISFTISTSVPNHYLLSKYFLSMALKFQIYHIGISFTIQ